MVSLMTFQTFRLKKMYLKYYIIFVYHILRTVRFRKLWNYVLLRITFLRSTWFKHEVRAYPPAFISIEPTNICNLQCPECPTGNKSSSVAKGYISEELFDRIIGQCKPYTLGVNIYFQGEPFLHSNIVSLISYVHKASIISSLSTNAHFIDEHNAEAIVQSGLTHLIVSFDGYDQASYEIYRKQGSFNRVIAALQALKDAKQKLRSHTPIIDLQCLLFSHTQNHRATIKALGVQYGADRVVFKTAQLYSDENKHLLPDTKHSRYTIKNGHIEIKHPLRNACWRMWSSCVVTWQGYVVPCCFDKNHTFAYGNAHENSLIELLNSIQAKRFKRIVHTNRMSIDICRNCSTK